MPAPSDLTETPDLLTVFLPGSPWLTITQAAQRAGISPRVLRQRLKRLKQKGECHTCGSHPLVLIRREVLDGLIERGFHPKDS